MTAQPYRPPLSASTEPAKVPIKRYYGWSADIPDQRDFLYGSLRKIPAQLPRSVDLRLTGYDSPIENQGELGSCTAHALVGNLQYLEKYEKKSVPYANLSRLFVYYNERIVEGTIGTDSGAQLRTGIKVLAKSGVPLELEWPYNISQFTVKPSSNVYLNASNHRIKSYHRINTTDEMRTCLSDGYPLVFGFSVYESFESDQVTQTGIVPMPKSDEHLLGGHAVCCIGYNDQTQKFLCRNSWGTGWGMKGYFTIPYQYLGNRNLSDDFWTIRLISWP